MRLVGGLGGLVRLGLGVALVAAGALLIQVVLALLLLQGGRFVALVASLLGLVLVVFRFLKLGRLDSGGRLGRFVGMASFSLVVCLFRFGGFAGPFLTGPPCALAPALAPPVLSAPWPSPWP